MPRGGRAGGRGGRRGPDLSWDDSEAAPFVNKPAPTFPRVDFPTPLPLSPSESSAVKAYISFRNKTRSSPLYAILDPSSLTDDKGKIEKRKGFDPFTEQETFSLNNLQKKRVVPEISGLGWGNGDALKYFPAELWFTVDPKRKGEMWKKKKNLDGSMVIPGATSKKRKRLQVARHLQEEEEQPRSASDDDNEDSDAIVSAARRKKKSSSTKDKSSREAAKQSNTAKQKAGLDAEDEYPENPANPQNPDGDGDGEEDEAAAGEEEEDVEDSEFEEDSEEDNDYQAEQYFDGGEDEDGVGWGDDGGGGDEEGMY